MKFVAIRWRDPNGIAGWCCRHDIKDFIEPLSCVSVGFVMRKTDSHIIISMGRDDENTKGLSHLAIPLGCIDKIINMEVEI